MKTKKMLKLFTALLLAVSFSAFTALTGCSGDTFEKYQTERQISDSPPLPDTTPPSIMKALAVEKDKITVEFNEPVDPVTASEIGNYHIQGNNIVELQTSVPPVIAEDGKTVTITVKTGLYGMQHGKEYTLLVQRIKDVNNNAILNAFSTFTGRGVVVAVLNYNGTPMQTESPWNSYNTGSFTFTISGDNVGAYMYSSDDSAWSSEIDISVPIVLNGLDLNQGMHVLKVVGKNSVSGEWQNVNEASETRWMVDTVAPTAILSHIPGNVIGIGEIDIVVGGADVTQYQYSINGESWSEFISSDSRITRKDLADGTYSLSVRGRDDAGNIQTDDTICSWRVVTNSPVVVITGMPATYSSSRSYTMTIAGTNVNYYRYALNGAWSDYYTVADPIKLYNCAEGENTLQVVGSTSADATTEGEIVTIRWTVDVTPPVSILYSLPPTMTNSQRTAIEVKSGDADMVAYTYKVISNGYVGAMSGQYAVSSPIELSALQEGSYTLNVYGIDLAGNVQPESAVTSYSWNIDTTSPTSTLTGIPEAITNIENYNITVGGTGVTHYKSLLDTGIWSGEIAIATHIAGIASVGPHVLRVVGRDAAGNWQPLSSMTELSWEVDKDPPVAKFSSLPSGRSNKTVETFFVVGDDVVKYQYKKESGGTWSAVFDRIENPSIEWSSLADGSHTMYVIGIDKAGNSQSTGSPTFCSWIVDTSAPQAELSNLPPSPTNVKNVSVTVSGVVSYKYRVDGDDWSAERLVSQQIDLGALNLSDGEHKLEVIGKNSVGIWQSDAVGEPTPHIWVIDTVKPYAELLNKPAQAPTYTTSATTAAIQVSGIGVYSYKYKLSYSNDSGATYTVTRPYDVTPIQISNDNIIDLINLGSSMFKIEVLALDAAGNEQSTSTAFEWTVNATDPVALLSNLPSPVTSTTSISVNVSGVVAYKYKIDNAVDWSEEFATGVPINASGFGEGPHIIEVVGKNDANRYQASGSASTHSWVIDTQPPSGGNLVIENCPGSITSDNFANFHVRTNGAEAISKVKYKLNTGGFGSEIDVTAFALIPLANLVNDSYTISVIACDSNGNWMDPANAVTFSWVVDTLTPVALLSNYPLNPTQSKNLSVTVSGLGIVRYDYKLMKGVSTLRDWSVASSDSWILRATPITVSADSLLDGTYTLYVRGTKGGGNDQSLANATTYSWTVDTVAPSAALSGTPAASTLDRFINITVGGAGVVAFKYKLDAGDWVPLSTDRSVGVNIEERNLAYGSHTIYVKGRDEAGNWQADTDPDVTKYTWSIDYPAPASPRVSDNGDTTTSSVSFSWDISNIPGVADVKIQVSNNATFTDIYDGGAYGKSVGLTSGYTFTPTNPDKSEYYARVSVNLSSGKDPADASWSAWTDNVKWSNGISVVGSVKGMVKDGFTNTAVTSSPNVTTVNAYLTTDSGGVTSKGSGQTDGNGDFTIDNLATGTNKYWLKVTNSSYQATRKNNVSIDRGGMSNAGVIYLVPNSGGTNGVIRGTTIDSNDASYISGASVSIYDWNGALKETKTTNPSFSSSSLLPGVYTAVMSKTGYFNLVIDNIIVDGTYPAKSDLARQAMCMKLSEPQIRVIYQWGAFPSDPDMYMTGPTNITQPALDGPTGRFIVWSAAKSFYERDGAYSDKDISQHGDWYGNHSTASLVQDGVTGYGPEAINLFRCGGSQYPKGVYTYTVHRFAYNPNWSSSDGLSSAFNLTNVQLNSTNTVTGTVSAARDITVDCAVVSGSNLISPLTAPSRDLYYLNNYAVSGSGIPVGSYLTWFDRALSTQPFQIDSVATANGNPVTVSLKNRISHYGLYKGVTVTGTGIPAGTTVQSVAEGVNGTYTLTLSNAATNSNLQTLTFTPGWGEKSGLIRVYDSGGMVREIIFPTASLGSDNNSWQAVKINIQGNSRAKRTIIEGNAVVQYNIDASGSITNGGISKTNADW